MATNIYAIWNIILQNVTWDYKCEFILNKLCSDMFSNNIIEMYLFLDQRNQMNQVTAFNQSV